MIFGLIGVFGLALLFGLIITFVVVPVSPGGNKEPRKPPKEKGV